MTVGPRTGAALQAVGYVVEPPRGGRLRWKTTDPFGKLLGGASSHDAAMRLCLDHLRANAEALCGRMMATLCDGTVCAWSRSLNGYNVSRAIDFEVQKGTVHDAVLALFLATCCDPEAV